jgi:small-conductance mechanosensitive channel
VAALWLVGAFLLIRTLDVVVWSRRTPHLPRLISDLVGALIWLVVGLVLADKLLEIPLTGILTTSGVAVAVLGFALRNMLTSLFAGIALSLERTYRIGDWLETGSGAVGQVTEIGWLTTRLLTLDGIGLILPNAQLATQGFSNFNQPSGSWRDHVTVTLGYEVSPERGQRVLLAAVTSVAAATKAKNRQPDAKIVACGEHGVTWEVRYWIKDYAERVDVRDQVHVAVLHHLYKAGLAPTHHRLDLFHAPMPVRMLEHRTQLDVLLARSDLFGTLGQDDLSTIAGRASRLRIPAGHAIVRQGQSGSSLFVVVEGVLDVTSDADDGPPHNLGTFVPGDMFGEYSLLTGAPRSATVTARTDSLLFEITKADLLPVLERSPELAESMSDMLASRQANRLQPHPQQADVLPEDEDSLLQRIRAFFSLSQDRA